MRFTVLAVLGTLAGCNVAAKNPGVIECRGKGSITGSGEAAISLLGSGSNNFVLNVDCGAGLYVRQGADVSTAPASN